MNAPDTINKAPHYNASKSGVECITVARHMGFLLGNVLKYVWRADLKGSGIEDLQKARYYLDCEIADREAAASVDNSVARAARNHASITAAYADMPPQPDAAEMRASRATADRDAQRAPGNRP